MTQNRELDSEYEGQITYYLAAKYVRLEELLLGPDLGTDRVQVEIGDLLSALRVNGQSNAQIADRVDPERSRFTHTRFRKEFNQ